MIAYIALGSNMGNKKDNILQAVGLLTANKEIVLQQMASIYQTAPLGYTQQDWFLNTVIAVETTLNPEALLHRLLAIEQDLGRERIIHWGPRIIDLDLLIYEGITLNTPELILPHPRMTERAFVMVPLAEIAPELPITEGKRANQLATELKAVQEITLATGD